MFKVKTKLQNKVATPATLFKCTDNQRFFVAPYPLCSKLLQTCYNLLQAGREPPETALTN